jgi:hypothetical protein
MLPSFCTYPFKVYMYPNLIFQSGQAILLPEYYDLTVKPSFWCQRYKIISLAQRGL